MITINLDVTFSCRNQELELIRHRQDMLGKGKSNERDPNDDKEFVGDCQRYVSQCTVEGPREWQANGWQQQLERHK